jgi:diacylglycerol kinase family enzyme
MRRAVLFYNPHSGQGRDTHAIVERAAAVLREAGVEANVVVTLSAAEAGQQAKEAVAQGYDTIFACGGDGTIQDVAQGIIGSSAALAVIPLGTANVLAHDLGIPLDAEAAAHAALRAVLLRVSVGRLDCQSFDYQSSESAPVTRYFLSVAGVGHDGYLFHKLESGQKRTFGIVAYFLEAFHVWLTHRMEWFSTSLFSGSAENSAPPQRITQLLAVRLHNFGSVLRDLAPGASLLRNDFRVALFKTSSRWSYLLYVLRGMAGASWAVPGVELCNAHHIRLAPIGQNPVYVEADGELLAQLPAEISVVPDGLTLLVPPDFASRQPG